eukprot:superscaffoldBa00000184_g2486
MGTAWREIYTFSPDFQGPVRAHRTPLEVQCFPGHGPLSRGEPFPERPALHKEKRTPPGTPAVSQGSFALPHWMPRGAYHHHSRFRGLNPTPFLISRGQCRPSPHLFERSSPISKDPLTHVQQLVTWNPSPFQPSKFEYLQLPPRSVPMAAPPGPMP